MRSFLCVLAVTLLAGCATTPGSGGSRNLTVGTVQREVRVGMSGAEVAEALGSPNIVSTDEDRNEVWIYDKISSHYVETESKGSVAVIRFLSEVGPIAASSRGRTESTSQRTLTVVIKFDENGRVRDLPITRPDSEQPVSILSKLHAIKTLTLATLCVGGGISARGMRDDAT